jgi:hypothetical protein
VRVGGASRIIRDDFRSSHTASFEPFQVVSHEQPCDARVKARGPCHLTETLST